MFGIDKVTRTRRIAQNISGSDPRAYRRLVSEYRNMSGGGTGGPHLMGYYWTTVRAAYFSDWSDNDFTQLLGDLGEPL